MAKILIQTQVYENYGYKWKPKGGSDYYITNFHGTVEQATVSVMAHREQIEYNNEMFREHIINWQLVPDDYVTQYEQDQLDHEGIIRFSPKVL